MSRPTTIKGILTELNIVNSRRLTNKDTGEVYGIAVDNAPRTIDQYLNMLFTMEGISYKLDYSRDHHNHSFLVPFGQVATADLPE